MGKKLAGVTFGVVVLCASQSWAGTTGNGWAQQGAPAVPKQAQPQPQSQQTWVLHGKSVSCASMHGWRHSEYLSHCGHG